MPFLVKDLIAEKPIPVVATPEDSVVDAIRKMIKDDYSQLPVVGPDNRPIGMVTSDSILRAQTSFGVALEQLRVEHATVRADSFRPDSDLFELLDRLQNTYAVLIVDREDCLIGIVTNYDTAQYFRLRAEDIMLVEDIETMVKDFIQVAYVNEAGDIDEDKLDDAVQRISDSSSDMREKFESAIIHYLTLQRDDGSIAKPNNEWLEQIYHKHLDTKRNSKNFDDLNLYDFVNLLLDRSTWTSYKSVFHLERSALRNLLDRVRNTRNKLSHFRGDITPAERDHLRFTANWLARYQDTISMIGFTPKVSKAGVATEQLPNHEIHVQDTIKLSEDETVLPIEDEPDPRDSRYAPLAIYLQNLSPSETSIQLSFRDVEDIIDGELPKSAFTHRAWWANDSVGHVQSQQWLEVGWKVNFINMTDRIVRFARIKERQKAYIDFFSSLLSEFRKLTQVPVKNIFPVGSHYQTVSSIAVGGRQVANFTWAYVRGLKFRIELYIDTGDQDVNKRAFDTLFARRDILEREFGSTMQWERLDKKRASRIAYYRSGSITDDEKRLQELREWAIVNMDRFYETLAVPAEEALEVALRGDD